MVLSENNGVMAKLKVIEANVPIHMDVYVVSDVIDDVQNLAASGEQKVGQFLVESLL